MDGRSGSVRFSSSKQLMTKLQPVPSIRSNSREVLVVSALSRSRSRVFYASEDIFNQTESSNNNNSSGKFRRTSSSRQSHDSGFSDERRRSSVHGKLSSVPARKLTKWSTTSNIKSFLKPNDVQLSAHISKLSDVLSCCGVKPTIFNSSSSKSKNGTANSSFDESTAVVNESRDISGELVHSSFRGTWPRRKKLNDDRNNNQPTINGNSKFYHSTKIVDKFRRHPKRIPVELDKRVLSNLAVQDWFSSLRYSTEDECTSTLQSKAVARDIGDLLAINARNCKDLILKIYDHYHRIISRMKTVQLKLNDKQWEEIGDYLSKMSSTISNFLLICCVDEECDEINYKQRLISLSTELQKKLTNSDGKWENEDSKSLVELLNEIQRSTEDLTKSLILKYVKEIVDVLEEPPSFLAVKIATSVLSILGIQDDELSRMVAVAGGVRVLLTVCIDPRYRLIRTKALRSLATLCCVTESICELELSGGVECVSEILADDSSSEEEKCESAGVIAQITSPSLDYNHSIEGLAENIPILIKSLTDLAKCTASGDSFLLSAAAIGNLTFFSKQTSAHVLKCQTIKVLINVCLYNHQKCSSVFAKDQVATVLVNMAGTSEGRSEIILNGGVDVLIRFLHLVSSSSYSRTDISALERVHQKSAISLSRLCSKQSVAERVVALGGVERLVQMCKDSEIRNKSDAVLVACLAVVRKIAAACGYQQFKDLNALELVEPRLLDSFLIYSSKQESYV
ncbi:hypothetical protein CHUAL_001029 [Chamberlinius hualienensis]